MVYKTTLNQWNPSIADQIRSATGHLWLPLGRLIVKCAPFGFGEFTRRAEPAQALRLGEI